MWSSQPILISETVWNIKQSWKSINWDPMEPYSQAWISLLRSLIKLLSWLRKKLPILSKYFLVTNNLFFQLRDHRHPRPNRGIFSVCQWPDYHWVSRVHFPNHQPLHRWHCKMRKPKHVHEQHALQPEYFIQIEATHGCGFQQNRYFGPLFLRKMDEGFRRIWRESLTGGHLFEFAQ